MPLITDYNQVMEIYSEAAELQIGLPAFCCEDRETLEAILASAVEMGAEIGVENLPIIPAWTVRYPPRGQMTLITVCGSPRLGTRLMFSDLEGFVDESSRFGKLRVMPHLDHAFPWLDGDILVDFVDRFASVMCDASEKPLEENMRVTGNYVDKVRGRVVVEGAVDEIYEAGLEKIKNELTTVEQTVRFLEETGVDIVVPNVGTEHRSTSDTAKYCSERAREISAAVGKRLCIHGTSSIPRDQLYQLPGDGFVKINIYTHLAVSGGQALARAVLSNLGNIFSEKQLQELIHQGVLGGNVLSGAFGETIAPIKPKLAYVANSKRRDAWYKGVKEACKEFLELFHYRRYGS